MTHVTAPDDLRPIVSQIIVKAIRAARNYDGKEANAKKLLELLAAFEAYAFELTTQSPLNHDASQREMTLAAELLGLNKAVTAMGLYEQALANFGRRYTADKFDIRTVQTKFIFLPTNGQTNLITGSGEGVPASRSENRTEQLITALNERGIYADDLIIYRGSVEPTMMRRQAYNLIQIPRLNHEILICDQVGEASFIGEGVRGPLFWASYRKDLLQMMEGVTRIVHVSDWKEVILGTIFKDGPGAKIKAFVPPGSAYPLTIDLILTKALEYAHDYNGRLPTQHSGEIAGLPGQTWSSWDLAIERQTRGLKHENIKSLPHLFRLYGLKMGQVSNPDMIARGIENLKITGHHGLIIQAEITLTEDLILTKALEYAEAHSGKLPGQKGDVPGMPGQRWGNWNASVVNCSHGLTRQNLTSLAHLFRLYGLKAGHKENPEAIEKAIHDLKLTGHHNLKIQKETPLTEDLILTKALAYAKLHELRLPLNDSGEIQGMPGQTWAAWEAALIEGSRGFTRENVKGLGHLFRLYGLKMGRKENPEVILAAINRLEETGQHALIVGDEFMLTEDLIITKALEYTKLHAGKLPAANGCGEVDGMPGQTWSAWHGSIIAQARGLTRENVRSLAHLFRLYGLKIGSVENPEVIAQALTNIENSGHHGLHIVEEPPFNEDLILIKALEFAEKHGGKLPTWGDEVPGMPGQKWNTWNAAIKNCNRGFTRPNVNGLSHLLQLYGLKDENNNVITDAVAQAISNVHETGTHGLKIIENSLETDALLKPIRSETALTLQPGLQRVTQSSKEP